MSYVVITGASSGIGAGMAREFAQKGYNLAICARRLDRLESLKQDIADYKKVNRYISDFKLEGSSIVMYKTLNGQKYATILGLYYIREGSGLEYSYTKFTLREDAQGHWKLLYWELADESDINE